MKLESLFNKGSYLKEKFCSLFVQKKKFKALNNYSQCHQFYHDDYLSLIHKCMESGFLDDKESDFLDHLIQKYNFNYLDWTHKTQWLKKHMYKCARENFTTDPYLSRPLKESLYNKPLINLPFHLLQQYKQNKTRRI